MDQEKEKSMSSENNAGDKGSGTRSNAKWLGIIGILLVKRISQNVFNRAVQVFAVGGALFLIFT